MRASTRTVRAVAALLTATSPIAAAFPAVAQQQMLGGPDVAKCRQIQDPIKAAKCVDDYMAASIEHSKARIAAAEARTRTALAEGKRADEEGECARRLVEAARNPEIKARGAAILAAAGTNVAGYGGCKLLKQLTP